MTARPVFVLGIMRRSGTNFLRDLLVLHPQCEPASVQVTGRPLPVPEDFFLHESDSLLTFSAHLTARWRRHWNRWGVHSDEGELQSLLLRHLGDGFLQLLAENQVVDRIITKTPSLENLPRFFDIFPDSPLLLLVRDGRAVVESGIRTFGWDFQSASYRWAQAASSLIEFDRAATGRPYLIVRYEDLLNDLETEIGRVLQFLDLDVESYDFAKAKSLPVRGSSDLASSPHGVHWRPIERTTDFEPTDRWKLWRQDRRERFSWIAGAQLRHFGYEGSVDSFDARGRARQRVLDLRYGMGRQLKSILRRLGLRGGRVRTEGNRSPQRGDVPAGLPENVRDPRARQKPPESY